MTGSYRFRWVRKEVEERSVAWRKKRRERERRCVYLFTGTAELRTRALYNTHMRPYKEVLATYLPCWVSPARPLSPMGKAVRLTTFHYL